MFLIHLVEAWDGCADVVDAMAGSEDFEPIVVSIPRRFNGDTSFNFEESVHRFLDAENVEHVRVTVDEIDDGLARVRALSPDIVFRQSQWDADIPPAFATEQLAFVRTGLIPYETMNIVENVPHLGTSNTALDSPFHRDAWIVFCTNELVLEEARASASSHGRFEVVGHPKADRVPRTPPAWPLGGERRGRRAHRIAWSAHHSIGTNWTGFGAFPLMAPAMLRWAQERDDCEFVFLPHPALVAFCNRPESPITRADFDAWHAQWSALDNTATSTGGRYAEVLTASELMVTDGLSMLVEYQLLTRPLIFFERPDHRPLNRIGELVRTGVHAVTTSAEVRRVADELLCTPDPLASQQRANVATLFPAQPATPRIIDALRARMRTESAR